MNDIKLPNIVITGTPGVGKTSLSILLCDKLNEELKKINSNKNFTVLNLSKVIVEKKLYKDWNEEFQVPEFEEELVVGELNHYVPEGGYILDFHSSYFFPEEWVDLVILLRCNNTVLYDRLKERGYNQKKIEENVECEIMEVSVEDVYENYDKSKVLQLANESVDQMETNIEEIMKFISKLIKVN
jgi:broad-specificity NMP kinase